MGKIDQTMVNLWDNSVDKLLNEGQSYVQTVSLVEFRERLLPILASGDSAAWVNAVGHPCARIRVVRVVSPTQHELVYDVPSLMTSTITTIPEVGKHALDGQLITAYQHISRNPRNGARILEQKLAEHVKPKPHVVANRIAFNKILVAEGYPPLPIPGTNGRTGVESSQPAVETRKTANGPLEKVDYLDEWDDA